MITLNSMLTSKGSQNTELATHHVAVTEKFMLTCCYRPGCHHHCTRRADQYHHPHGTMEDLLLCNFLFQKWISTPTMGRYVGATCRCHSCSDTCYGHYMATIFVGWWIALLPSSILKKEFHSQGHYSESFIQKTVQMALLSINLDQTSHYCISE